MIDLEYTSLIYDSTEQSQTVSSLKMIIILKTL